MGHKLLKHSKSWWRRGKYRSKWSLKHLGWTLTTGAQRRRGDSRAWELPNTPHQPPQTHCLGATEVARSRPLSQNNPHEWRRSVVCCIQQWLHLQRPGPYLPNGPGRLEGRLWASPERRFPSPVRVDARQHQHLSGHSARHLHQEDGQSERRRSMVVVFAAQRFRKVSCFFNSIFALLSLAAIKRLIANNCTNWCLWPEFGAAAAARSFKCIISCAPLTSITEQSKSAWQPANWPE